jgi:NADPH:quinone reductase-like Zn-dependent oxidoreductase
VESVGQDVTEFAAGDEVYGTCDGSFAQYARARAARLAPKPANLSFEQAAAVPVSGLSALQGVRDRARVHAGQSVLIIGASGGVGTFAVQIAKSFGAEVTAVCSRAKADLVRAVGADHVLLWSPLVSEKLGTFVASENSKDLVALTDLLETGKLAPAVDRTFPLSETPAAIRYLIEGHARGKVAITVP